MNHIKPWQRILIFFIRTQQPHDWQSPTYEFTSEQQRLWDIVWHRAQARLASPDPMDTDEEPYKLQPLERAVMDFCINLLRQKIRHHKYGCAFIYASAVLGRKLSG